MCYCLTRVDVDKWFCSVFLWNGNICVVPEECFHINRKLHLSLF